MRVPPPGLLKLDRRALLDDVKERLAEVLPAYANREEDPTDPGWLLLEQAAWLVELMTEQLDKYPFAVVQQLVHMMGGHIRPAQPALGVLLAEPVREGMLDLDPRRPSPWRFFTPQSEDLDIIEFVPAESGVNIVKAGVTSLCEVSGEELHLIGPAVPASGLDGQVMARRGRRRSRALRHERITFTAVTNNPDGLVEGMHNAIKQLEDRRLGWLRLEVSQPAKEKVILTATIDPGKAFERMAPGGIWVGGDLEGDWGSLDGSSWTPPVTIARHPMLPPHLHDQYPLPGSEEGQILVIDVPENFPVAELLVRKASPTPQTVLEAIWTTLANYDARLAPVNRIIEVHVDLPEEPGDLEPRWLAGAIAAGHWPRLTQRQPNTIASIAIEPQKKAGSVRLAWVHEGATGSRVPKPTAWAVGEDGKVSHEELAVRERWRLSLPATERGAPMPTVVAYDVDITPDVRSVLMVSGGHPSAIYVNALLVVNAPAVSDGRNVLIDRNVPISANLLHEDVVTAGVIDQLLGEPIVPVTAGLLRQLALAHFSVQGQDGVRDFEGVQLDATEGTMVFNAPNESGTFRPFRPGTNIRLDWYRRTDGASGNQGAGAIQLLDQPPPVVPSFGAVINPLPTYYGADRESAEAAVERMFGPSGGVPVTPADFEREVRLALGSRGRRWLVRCWTYAERALVSTAFWPFPTATDEPDAEVVAAERALASAGPDTLLVVLGPRDAEIEEDDLDWARRTVQRMVQRLAARLPIVRNAVVMGFKPLTLTVPEDDYDPTVSLPIFDLAAMEGEIRDLRGHASEERPAAVLLLNAAVVDVVAEQQEILE